MGLTDTIRPNLNLEPSYTPNAIDRKLFELTAHRPARHIPQNGMPYIERYFLFESWGGLAWHLHRYLSGDQARGCHSHPWPLSVGIPLTGGYIEEVMVQLDHPAGPITRPRNIFPLRPNMIPKHRTHRIQQVKPGTWTLFGHRGKSGHWGFYEQIAGTAGPDGEPLWGFVPAAPSSGRKWWLDAPLGKDINRAPLGYRRET